MCEQAGDAAQAVHMTCSRRGRPCLRPDPAAWPAGSLCQHQPVPLCSWRTLKVRGRPRSYELSNTAPLLASLPS